MSKINFIPNDINITNTGTLSPTNYVNGSVLYSVYILTQNLNNIATNFTLLREIVLP